MQLTHNACRMNDPCSVLLFGFVELSLLANLSPSHKEAVIDSLPKHLLVWSVEFSYATVTKSLKEAVADLTWYS